MAKKTHAPDTAVTAALALAAERGWRRLALADIAERAGMPLADLVGHFSGKTAILAAYADRIDQHMMAAPVDREESPRDRLFDVIMRRFDAMAADRPALSVILRQSSDDPWAILCGGRSFFRSMALVLETAGISASGISGLVKIQAVSAVFLYAFKTFLEDDSADHARTMAALDKGLRRASDCHAFIFHRRAASGASPESNQR